MSRPVGVRACVVVDPIALAVGRKQAKLLCMTFSQYFSSLLMGETDKLAERFKALQALDMSAEVAENAKELVKEQIVSFIQSL